MKADFSGYATKANVKCSDGRTILPNAFQHQDKMRVPLVWQHGHNDPENVVGHAILENREDGVYTYGFFNNTPKAQHLKEAVAHGDIRQMSIWANQLVQKANRVLHGAIREVSLVLSGANPEANIENITIRHGEDLEVIDEEAIIHSGMTLEHVDYDPDDDTDPDPDDDGDPDPDDDGDFEPDPEAQELYDSLDHSQKQFFHSMLDAALTHADLGDDATIEDVYNSMNEKQKAVLHYMLGEAISAKEDMKQSNLEHADELGDDATIEDVYNSMTDQQKAVVHYMLGEAVATAGADLKQSNTFDEEGNPMSMSRNVFENQSGTGASAKDVLSHSQLQEIAEAARKGGSLKMAIEEYGLQHGIENIDQLFPDAVAVDSTPEFLARRTEWVASIMSGVRRSPFSRVKSLYADLTLEAARAKGYVKGNLKKDEFFPIAKRVTTPTTVYKKQKLDRDDVVDITDFDVINWMKGEMRLMLDEEIARAILIGDGRESDDEDKIDESAIRPIATDHELYTVKVYVNINDANSSYTEVIDELVRSRRYYRGSGVPNLYISDIHLSEMLLLKDSTGRDLYPTLDVLATKLRVKQIITVEVMEEVPNLVGVIVNPSDYVVGATRGGEINMFDDFDIDYNAMKYLMEGRMSGALTKLKSAMSIWKTASNAVLVVPTPPTFDPETGELTITNTTGVVYKHGATTVNAAGSPYSVGPGDTWVIDATPASSAYYFADTENDQWSFTADA